jgi:hypothetical protein
MAKSSYAAVLLMAGWGAAAAAAPPAPPPEGWVTADEAMKHYHETFSISGKANCPDQGTGEEIVVCGRTERRNYNLPLPIERDEGEIVRHINEPGGGVAAMSAPCFRGCASSGVPVLKIIFAAPKIVRHILHGDD